MRNLASLCLMLGSVELCAAPAASQVPPYGWCDLGAVCDNGDNRVIFSGYDDGVQPEVVAFDIYRRALGSCAARERINESPLPRQSQEFTLEFVDTRVVPQVMYEYDIVGVDAQRSNPIDPYLLYPLPGGNTSTFSSCGTAPIAHGSLRHGGWILELDPCAGSCYSYSVFVEEYPESVRPYIGTGEPLLLFGSFGWSVEGHLMHVVTAVPTACTVGLVPLSWTGAKSLYR